ncbi:hypothetical protein B5T_01140 [Alloalcanivorax dieselolei B5]|uniref:Uncharacterized protein n=1 Tax=Alcanivorax dieselolei (strain DSM 16502 / CGMCC 1.3690 / MCCC 1A00001 / B-5) TaxID=930169 RepID=K0C9Y8_ALCDB|nr:hypothetical protein [Alloalcanivorax dieselolei]AFT69423.1 hypothetical protein B5T_01140 [Alloalcanivorax dieselolei B5]GGJ92561.1 hypothetical protein GCM10007426_22050 [Alloalcanivorax dieselolei]
MPRLAIQGLLAITATLWLSQPTLARVESSDIDSPTVETLESGVTSATETPAREREEKKI